MDSTNSRSLDGRPQSHKQNLWLIIRPLPIARFRSIIPPRCCWHDHLNPQLVGPRLASQDVHGPPTSLQLMAGPSPTSSLTLALESSMLLLSMSLTLVLTWIETEAPSEAAV